MSSSTSWSISANWAGSRVRRGAAATKTITTEDTERPTEIQARSASEWVIFDSRQGLTRLRFVLVLSVQLFDIKRSARTTACRYAKKLAKKTSFLNLVSPGARRKSPSPPCLRGVSVFWEPQNMRGLKRCPASGSLRRKQGLQANLHQGPIGAARLDWDRQVMYS